MALNPRQIRFCELYHASGNGCESYAEAYGASAAVSAANAWRLLRNDGIRNELARLAGETATLAAMSREDMADYLVSAIMTPAGDIDEHSPLCEEVTRHVGEDGVEVVKIKSVSKLGAAKELIRLTGMAAPQKVEVSANSEVVEMLRVITGAK